MPTYRIYRQWHMEGYTDIKADSEAEALKKVAEEDSDEPHDCEWQIDGYGSCHAGPQYQLYSVDGKKG